MKLQPYQPDVDDGMTFPSYYAHAKRLGDSVYVVIVLDPDCEENVIYAYGPALDF